MLYIVQYIVINFFMQIATAKAELTITQGKD